MNADIVLSPALSLYRYGIYRMLQLVMIRSSLYD